MRRFLAALGVFALAVWLSLGSTPVVGGSSAEAQAARPEMNTGAGLRGAYFDNKNFTAYRGQSVAPRVSYAWGVRRPTPRVHPNSFSVRWQGMVEAPQSGAYTFHTRASDGVRLWVGGKLLTNDWRLRSRPTERTGRIQLEAGRRYPVRMDYFDQAGNAAAALSWEGPGFGKQLVPRNRLYLPGSGQPAPEPTPVPDGMRAWSDPATWGGAGVPEGGEEVTIPAGQKVLLDTNTPNLGSLTVDGELHFAEKDLELTAGRILVHGLFQVGSEEDPFENDATITLTGNDETVNVMRMGNKFLGAMGGTLEIHGEKRRGWTRLAETAKKGATTITVEDASGASGWRAGDRIAIASTDYDYDHAEERVITAVSGDTLTLGSALSYRHWGTLQTYAGKTVDQRAEVALLSRNVLIRGDGTSEQSGFGGHVMVMGDGKAHVSGVEISRAGQAGILARYPFHFHMMRDAGEGSYIENSSIHNTYNRCVTVHGTHNALVRGNVCHENRGHAYFMEDGNEYGNTFEGNLGMTTRAPKTGEALLAHEKPGGVSTFWITNPDNAFRDNVAAGADGFGFWYALPDHPVGPSATNDVWPMRTPLGEFANNTAHSNQRDGLRVEERLRDAAGNLDVGHYDPRTDPSNAKSAPVTASFTGLEAYKNRVHGGWLRGSNMRLTGAKLSDNGTGAAFPGLEVFLDDSLVVGETANKGNPSSGEPKGLDGRELPEPRAPGHSISGFQFYDGRVGARGVSFANFRTNDQRRATALATVHDNEFSFHQDNHVSGLTFENADKLWNKTPLAGDDGDQSMVFRDRDGSLTGDPGAVVTAKNEFMTTPGDCSPNAAWNVNVCADNDYATLWVEDADDNPSSFRPLTLERDDGAKQTLDGWGENYSHAVSNVVTDRSYEVSFSGELPRETMYALWRSKYKSVTIKVPITGDFRVKQGLYVHKSLASLNELRASRATAYFHDEAAGVVHIKLVDDAKDTYLDWEEMRIERL